MAAKYRLGLDVGTASVCAAAFSLDKDGFPDKLIWHHTRIFNEPLEKGQGGLVSKKAGRRKARMQRRQIDRRAARLRRIAHLANLLGLNREEIPPDDGSSLPRLRAQAATEKIEPADLLRIFLRLSKRRGYKGEFRAKKKGEVAEGSNELKQAMRALATERGIALKDENDAGITLGQYLLYRLDNGLPTKLKVKEDDDGDFKGKRTEKANAPKNLYALRSMVEHEFETIWNTQAKHHPILNSVYKDKPIREHFYDALFFQRPLKSAAGLVAQCSLEPTLQRAPRAQMAFQRFRIEKTLADLRWGSGKRAEKLTCEQKQIIRDLLDNQEKATFESIYEVLEEAGYPKPQGKGLNLDRSSREELPGNKTLAAFRKLDKHSAKHHPERANNLEQTFLKLDEKTQIAVINFLAELGSPEQLDDPEWHNSFVKRDRSKREFREPLIEFVNRIKDHDNFDRLSKMGFDSGRASYSVKALRKLTDWLKEPEWPGDWSDTEDGAMSVDEEGAIRACYRAEIKKRRKVVQQNRLPAPKPTGNAVVDGALRQIQWIINKMIAELGYPPEEIVVELSRGMNLGITRRNEREAENAKNQKVRRDAEQEIRDHGMYPTDTKVDRYLLWSEQDKSFCPYCNQSISFEQAMSGAATECEHIIPKKLSQIGKKRSELVLSHSSCNHAKGDFTPFEAWGMGRNSIRWQSVESAANRFLAKALALKKKFDDARRNDRQAPFRGEMNGLFRKAALLKLQEAREDETVDGFADRQLHQTSWIAKEAALWLACLCPNKVSTSRGELTAMLRKSWKLDTVIPEVRYENKLPVLDEEGKPVTPEDFAQLRKYLERNVSKEERGADKKANPGLNFNRRPNKRIDHRHHLIDAITLALTSRSLFQQMAIAYKIAAEKEERPRLKAPAPPLLNVRSAALQAVRECKISFKPDRYPEGALFKDTAYGVAQRDGEGRLRLTLRTAVAGLGKIKGKTSLESARKAISNIVSDSVREIVSEVFESRIKQGLAAGTVLEKPIFHPRYNKPIKKVRCYETFAEDSLPIMFRSRHGEHRKYLVSAGYAYVDLRTDGSKEHRLVKIRDALCNRKRAAPENVLRLYKGDTVLDSKDGLLYRVCLFKAAGTIALLPIWEPRSFKEANEKAEKGSKVGGTISFAPAAKRLKRID
ncbi:MAG: type II CRISPR RNA-guided endonuclease Cas9 [Proteobacteria bacterium]|nr:type II CRISPR RNA-guided endonuclease Cas9 [Pseudomonadota bacterium]